MLRVDNEWKSLLHDSISGQNKYIKLPFPPEWNTTPKPLDGHDCLMYFPPSSLDCEFLKDTDAVIVLCQSDQLSWFAQEWRISQGTGLSVLKPDKQDLVGHVSGKKSPRPVDIPCAWYVISAQ